MTVRSVVHKDFLDARRSKIVWFVGGHYALLTVLFFLQVWVSDSGSHPEVLEALWNMVFVGAVFIPAIALVAAYLAIAGERESGSIKHLLSTPISRRDVVVGKYLSRTMIVGASLLLGFVLAAVLSALLFDSLMAGVFVRIAALTTIYALAYVAVAIGISAATASRSRAMAGAIGFYFVTNLMTVFDRVSALAAIEYVLNDLLGLGVGDDPIQFLGMLTNPTQAYFVSTIGAFPAEMTAAMELPAAESLSWYLQPEVGFLLLCVWLVGPILFGIYRFERADIG